jgi:hypothetical protein
MASKTSGETPTSFGISTRTMPAKPRATPTPCRQVIFSPRMAGASSAVITGCRPAMIPDTPDGTPFLTAHQTPAR